VSRERDWVATLPSDELKSPRALVEGPIQPNFFIWSSYSKTFRYPETVRLGFQPETRNVGKTLYCLSLSPRSFGGGQILLSRFDQAASKPLASAGGRYGDVMNYRFIWRRDFYSDARLHSAIAFKTAQRQRR
jgi:hypothetical protein